MAKKFSELRAKMPAASQERARKKTRVLRREMALNELRAAKEITQKQLADTLKVNQAAISKIERRTDMYVSTLRNIIAAMGGRLEIYAAFPDGKVSINQFAAIDEPVPAEL
ncbi:MAG: helix-turn-helix domain-containing protein [Bryobacteraceae bacterium]|nr:helix-turn-helix domain-containing protein [Bryobacteraceae bacterium]